MTELLPKVGSRSILDKQSEPCLLDPRDTEACFAIADFVIRRGFRTPAGRDTFDHLIGRFENRYP